MIEILNRLEILIDNLDFVKVYECVQLMYKCNSLAKMCTGNVKFERQNEKSDVLRIVCKSIYEEDLHIW